MRKGRPLEIEWQESEPELYQRYQQETDVHKRRKLQLLWLLRSGYTLRESCRLAAVKERTGQRYLKWYREDGLDGLLNRNRGGDNGHHSSFLSEEQQQLLKAEADAGRIKTVWEGVKWVKQQFGVTYSYEGMRSLFKRLRLKKKVPRPQHVKSDKQAQDAWKKGDLLTD